GLVADAQRVLARCARDRSDERRLRRTNRTRIGRGEEVEDVVHRMTRWRPGQAATLRSQSGLAASQPAAARREDHARETAARIPTKPRKSKCFRPGAAA